MRRATVLRTLTLGVCTLVSLGGSCDSSPTAPSTVQNCDILYDANWPQGGLLTFNKPARCPFKITGETTVPYAAHASLPNNVGVAYQNYEAICINYFGKPCGVNVTSSWTDVSGNYHVDVSGTYQAGSGGFPNSNPRDLIRNRFFRNGNFVYGTVELVYRFGSGGAAVSGPSQGVGEGLQFNVSAWPEDPLQVGNVTFAWYKDGNYVATSGSDSFGTYTFTADAGASSHEIGVVITDELGRANSGYATVTVCPAPQFYC
jgi:hypothetical protein